MTERREIKPTREKKQACLLNCSFESTLHSGVAVNRNSAFFSNGYSQCATSAPSLFILTRPSMLWKERGWTRSWCGESRMSNLVLKGVRSTCFMPFLLTLLSEEGNRYFGCEQGSASLYLYDCYSYWYWWMRAKDVDTWALFKSCFHAHLSRCQRRRKIDHPDSNDSVVNPLRCFSYWGRGCGLPCVWSNGLWRSSGAGNVNARGIEPSLSLNLLFELIFLNVNRKQLLYYIYADAPLIPFLLESTIS